MLRAFAADLHCAVENAAQAKGIACEAVESLDRLVCVRVWRVGDVIHCTRRHAWRVSGLQTPHPAHAACAGARHAQQPTSAARAARHSQARWNFKQAHAAQRRSLRARPEPAAVRAVPHAQRAASSTRVARRARWEASVCVRKPLPARRRAAELPGTRRGVAAWRAAQGFVFGSAAPLMETSDMAGARLERRGQRAPSPRHAAPRARLARRTPAVPPAAAGAVRCSAARQGNGTESRTAPRPPREGPTGTRRRSICVDVLGVAFGRPVYPERRRARRGTAGSGQRRPEAHPQDGCRQLWRRARRRSGSARREGEHSCQAVFRVADDAEHAETRKSHVGCQRLAAWRHAGAGRRRR